MAMSKGIYDNLLRITKPEQALQVRKNISVSEGKAIYIASINPEREVAVFPVDGKLVTEGNRCDKLILSQYDGSETDWIGHFIELKGCDISHAITQLEATLNNKMFQDVSLKQKYARIVGRKFPANTGNSDVERARINFIKRYKCELRCLKYKQEDKI